MLNEDRNGEMGRTKRVPQLRLSREEGKEETGEEGANAG
jgi:hypothetical protein